MNTVATGPRLWLLNAVIFTTRFLHWSFLPSFLHWNFLPVVGATARILPHYIVVWDIQTHQASPTISNAQLWAAPVNWNTGAAEEFGSPLDPQLSLGAFAEHGTLPGQDFGEPSASQPSLAASVERGTRPGQDFEGPPDSQLSLGEFAEHDTY